MKLKMIFTKRNTWRKRLCIVCFLGWCSLAVHAQKGVTGRVIDAGDEPVVGANVVEKGTTNGTVTDVDGNFSLSVRENATLQVSYVGYITQEISVLTAWGGGQFPCN
jgi:hypothetical protein